MHRLLVATVALASLALAGNAGAVSLSGPTTISDPACCSAPRNTSFTFDPASGTVQITGWADLSGAAVGSTILLGFADRQQVDNAGSTFMGGAYVYISRASASTVWIGPSDGNLGGEIVQEFDSVNGETYFEFTATIGLGQIDVDWTAGAQSGSLSDTYGVVKTLNNNSAYAWDEFEYGAYLAADLYVEAPRPGTIDFHVSAVPEPTTALLVALGLAALGRGRRR